MKIAIFGYGRLGKAVEKFAGEKDVEIFGIFSRRNLISEYSNAVYPLESFEKMAKNFDVGIVTESSFSDKTLMQNLTCRVNTVDCFDNHLQMEKHLQIIGDNALKNNKTCFVGCGWDPGIFSIIRCLYESLPKGQTTTFWGEGVSFGHTNALKSIDGVLDAVQYTVPKQLPYELSLRGVFIDNDARNTHRRVCYVLPKPTADRVKIVNTIINMDSYFNGYETDIHFVNSEEFEKYKNDFSHKGVVTHNCINNANATFSLKMQNNAFLTANIMLSYAKANYLYQKSGIVGAFTPLDIPVKYLCDTFFDKI